MLSFDLNHSLLILFLAFWGKQSHQCEGVCSRGQELRTARRNREAPHVGHDLLSPSGVYHSEIIWP
jgi:hypothetical protein